MALPLILGALAIGIGKAAAGYAAQNKANRDNTKEALISQAFQFQDLTIRGLEEAQAARQERTAVDKQGALTKSAAGLGAAEAGVGGAAIDLLLKDISSEEATARLSILDNLGISNRALDRQRKGVKLQTDARIRSVPRGSYLNAGLQIAGSALQAGPSIVAGMKTG